MSLVPVREDDEVRGARDSARRALASGDRSSARKALSGTGLLGRDVPFPVALAVAEECGRAGAVSLVSGDLTLAAALLGSGEQLVVLGSAYASRRCAFGRPLSRFQVQRHAFAFAAARLTGGRALIWRAAEFGDPMDLAAALPEAADAAWFAAETVLQVHGASGYCVGEIAERWAQIARTRAGLQAR